MAQKLSYDIFISYRHDGGAQYARILQLMLAQRGYKVFLDYDELRDGLFNEKIKKAIAAAPIFIFVLSKDSVDRCANAEDWVAKEISEAVRLDKKIIPVNPDGQFDGIHTDVPEKIRAAVSDNQHSEIYFGQVLGATVDQMIRDRIVPIVGARTPTGYRDEDFDAAKETLQRQDAHRRWMKRLAVIIAVFFVAVVAVVANFIVGRMNDQRDDRLQREHLETLRADIEKRHSEFHPILRSNLTEAQLHAIDTLLTRMRPLDDNLWISQTEFSRGEWATIMGEVCPAAEYNLPVTAKYYHEIVEVVKDSLYEMAGIDFDLPSADEWRLAAEGGKDNPGYVYAGSDDPDSVAWFDANSGNRLHPVINSGKIPNTLDLFNMNGNAAELCNSPATGDNGEDCWIICGGDYASPASDVKNISTRTLGIDKKDEKVGFRIVIRNEENEL